MSPRCGHKKAASGLPSCFPQATLQIQRIIVCAAGDGHEHDHDLVNQFLRHIKLFQRALQVAGDSRKMRFLQVQVFVGFPHAPAGVVVRAAKGHGEKSFLFADLSIHVDIIKEVTDVGVGQIAAIENIDSGVDGVSTTHLFVKAAHENLL
jgi:hypothetical protein